MVEQFTAEQHRAQEALSLGNISETKPTIEGRRSYEFEEGRYGWINPRKVEEEITMKYDGLRNLEETKPQYPINL